MFQGQEREHGEVYVFAEFKEREKERERGTGGLDNCDTVTPGRSRREETKLR